MKSDQPQLPLWHLHCLKCISTKFNCLQAKAEQEEEFISNTLLKKIQELKKEKENLALNYEQEEECLTNDLSRKLDQVYSGNLNTGKKLKRSRLIYLSKNPTI